LLMSVLFLTSYPTLAQEPQKLLLLPLEIKGNYRPIQQDALSELLVDNIKKAAPHVSTTVYEEKTYMMSPKEAARLGKMAGANFVLYGDLSFRKDVKAASLTGANTEGYPGGSGIKQGFAGRYMVTVAGVGHGKLVDVASGKIIAERPELLLQNEYTGAVKGGAKMEALEQKLADQCVRQFAKHLVEKIQEEVKNGRR